MGQQKILIKEGTLYYIINLIIVLESSILDRAWTILDTFPPLLQKNFQRRVLHSPIESFGLMTYWVAFARAIILPTSTLPQEYLNAFRSIRLGLGRRYREYHLVSCTLPSSIKQDCYAYATFTLATDDLIDETCDIEQSSKNLEMMNEWLELVYSSVDDNLVNDSVDLEVLRRRGPSTLISFLDPEKSRAISSFLLQKVPLEAQASFLVFTTIAHRTPRYIINELFSGFKSEIGKQRANKSAVMFTNEEELIKYSRQVTGFAGEFVAWSFLCHGSVHCVQDHNFLENRHRLLAKFNDLATSINMTLTARDIRKDAEKYGRVHIPLDWFNDQKPLHLRTLTMDPKIFPLPSLSHLFSLLEGSSKTCNHDLNAVPYETYAALLVDLGGMFYEESIPECELLSKNIRGHIRALIELNRETARSIVNHYLQTSSKQQCYSFGHEKLSKRRMIWIIIKALYLNR